MPSQDTIFHHLNVGSITVDRSWTGGSVAPAGSDPTSYGSDSLTPVARTRKTWGNTPDYYFKRKMGLPLPTNELNLVKTRGRLFLSGTRIAVSFNPYEGTVTDKAVYGSVPLDWSEKLEPRTLMTDDELFVRARLKLKEDRTWNVPLFGAELHKTLELGASTATTVARVLSLIKRGRLGDAMAVTFPNRKGKRFQRGASNAVLAYKYGVTPFLNDLYDSAAALSAAVQARWDNQQPQRMKITQKRVGFISEPTVYFVNPQDVTGVMNLACSDSRRLYVKFHVADPQQYIAARFGFTNPLTTVWDLVPFSFVFDWFSSFNNWLSSFDAGVGIEFDSCFLARRREAFGIPVGSVQSTYFNIGCTVVGSAQGLVVERVSLPSLPQALPQGITWSPGLLKKGVSDGLPSLSAARLTSALALLRQLT